MVLSNIKNLFSEISGYCSNFWSDITYKIKHLAESNTELCYFYLFNKNYRDLDFRLRILEKLYPENINFWFFRGFTFLLQDKKEEAINLFKKVINADSNHEFAKYFLSIAKAESKSSIPTVPEAVTKQLFNITAKFYNELYKDEIEAYRALIEKNSSLLKMEQEKVKTLDCGCANGSLTKAIYKNLGKSPDIVGVDFSENMCEIASKQKVKNKAPLYREVHCSDICTYLQTSKEKYDIILINGLIGHLENIEQMIKLAKERLFDHGAIILGFIFDDQNDEKTLSKDLFNFIYPRKMIRDLLSENKLRILSDPINASYGYNIYIVKKEL